MRDASDLRLGVLSTHLIQYFSPLYRHLSKGAGALQVAYLKAVSRDAESSTFDPGFGREVKWDVDLRSGYDWVSFGLADAPNHFSARDYLTIAQETERWVRSFKPDVVLVPGWLPFYTAAVAPLVALGVPLIYRPEARVRPDSVNGRALGRDLVVRAQLRYARAAATIGTWSRDELMRLGFTAEQLFDSPYVIDTDLWTRRLAEERPRREEHRARLGLEEGHVALLFVGKLMDYKRPLELLEAFAALHARHPEARLLLVGDGPLREQVRERVASLKLTSAVKALGFINQTQLPELYAAADVSVLPSWETWGLVLNEAMLAGLPLAASIDAGGCRDIVLDDVTGYRLQMHHPEEVTERLCLLMDAERRAKMREALGRLAPRFTLETAARGILQAAAYAREHA